MSDLLARLARTPSLSRTARTLGQQAIGRAATIALAAAADTLHGPALHRATSAVLAAAQRASAAVAGTGR